MNTKLKGLDKGLKTAFKPERAPPVGYWKFDEGQGSIARDSSGNGNDGIIHRGATWTTGKIGDGLHFNGIDSWVEIPTNATLTNLSQITLEAWIQEDSVTSQLKGIISKCDGWAPPINAEYFLGTNDNGRVFFETDNSTAILSTQTDRLITQAGRWYHVAATWSGDSYTVYIDGQPVISGSCTPQNTLSNNLPVQIGRHGSWSGVYFQGIIDEVKIFNYARTAEDIQADAKPQQPPSPKALAVQLHGAFDYLSSESTRPKITALVTDAVTSDLVQGASVEINITEPDGRLWTTGVMTETSLGIYTWDSGETAQQMSSTLGTGIYVVTVGASLNSGTEAYDALEFHIDPPSPVPSPSYLLPTIIGCSVALIAIVAGTLIYMKKKKSQQEHV